jgi:thymidylate synthase ThyX
MQTKQSSISTFTYACEVLADSIHPQTKDRLTTIIVTFPRVVEKELLRHRSFSFSSESSRAMRATTVLQSVKDNLYKPVTWLKAKAGMVAAGPIDDPGAIDEAFNTYFQATETFVNILTSHNVSKQQANRYLEPFMGLTVVITGSKPAWDVFFALRISADADPVINETATFIKSVYDASTPEGLGMYEAHVPIYGKSDYDMIRSVAAVARSSYKNTNKNTTIEEDIAFADRLIADMHLSPFEHIATTCGIEEPFNGNLQPGWRQARKLLEYGWANTGNYCIYKPFMRKD